MNPPTRQSINTTTYLLEVLLVRRLLRGAEARLPLPRRDLLLNLQKFILSTLCWWVLVGRVD